MSFSPKRLFALLLEIFGEALDDKESGEEEDQ